MRLQIGAIGKLKKKDELHLFEHYFERAKKAGRSLGFKQVEVIERLESRDSLVQARKAEEASSLLHAIDERCIVIALDEHGEALSSRAFCDFIQKNQESGEHGLSFLIGGPDGHGEDVLQKAHKVISLGQMTWPHGLARVMLAEQIYRAMMIVSGHPYHRD